MSGKSWKWICIGMGGLWLFLIPTVGVAMADQGESTIGTIKREAQETVERGKVYAESKRKQYEEAIEEQLDQLDARIQDLKTQLDEAEVQAKAEIEEQLDALRIKKQAVAKKLADLRVASEDAWRELKSGITMAMQDLRESLDRALKEFD